MIPIVGKGCDIRLQGKLCAGLHHFQTALNIIGGKNLEVEARGKDILASGSQHDDGLVFFCLAERRAEVLQHGDGHDVYLAVVHGDGGDALGKAVGDTV